jgi:hypothetical protein
MPAVLTDTLLTRDCIPERRSSPLGGCSHQCEAGGGAHRQRPDTVTHSQLNIYNCYDAYFEVYVLRPETLQNF